MTLPFVSEDSRVVHRIFLASPGDLPDERQMVRDMVDELNRVIAPNLGIQLELYGWEQQRPRAGRPQTVINPYVDRCHLFIGLLAERWGTPTGADTSGFSEEFGRALERRADSEPPEIMLAFRYLDPARERDPGKQLKKVLKFRTDMQRERGILYQTFRTTAELRERLRDWLQQHLFELVQNRAVDIGARGSHAAPLVKTSPQLLQASTGSHTYAPPLLVSATDAVSHMLSQSEFDEYVKAGLAVSFEQLLRLRLHVNAWSFVLHNTEPLGTHDHNSLYQIREQVTLVAPEHQLIRSALVTDQHDVLPGWYWFRDGSEDLPAFLLRTALSARTIEAKARAIRLLGETRITVEAEDMRSICDSAAHDDTAQVARSVIAYARHLEDVKLLRDTESLNGFADNITQRERVIALLEVLQRDSPSAAIAEAARYFTEVPAEASQVLEKWASSVEDDVLAAILEKQTDARLLEIGIRIRIGRGGLSEAELFDLLISPSPRTREAVVRALIETGGRITVEEIRRAFPRPSTTLADSLLVGQQEQVDVNALVFELFRKLPEAELRAKVTFLSLDSAIAYRALGTEHFATFGQQLRRDLESRFSSSTASVGQLLGTQAEIRRLVKFIQDAHAEAAIAALAQHGGPDDVQYAIALLSNGTDVIDASPAIRLIAEHGDAQSDNALITYAELAYGDEAVEAARGAVRLSSGAGGALKRLLSSSKEVLVREGLRATRGTGKETILSLAQPLLGHAKEGIRLTAAAVIVQELDQNDLEEVMRKYRSDTTYFYDVGCWLDRVLYAPEPINAVFRTQLTSKL